MGVLIVAGNRACEKRETLSGSVSDTLDPRALLPPLLLLSVAHLMARFGAITNYLRSDNRNLDPALALTESVAVLVCAHSYEVEGLKKVNIASSYVR
jgi:hypothetical protein